MPILLLIICALFPLAAANPPVLTQVQVDNITHSAARITWRTDSSSTTKLQWGLTTSYSYTKNVNWQNYTTHGNFISGLLPATTYNVRACSTDSVEACSTNLTFTTAVAPAVHPDYPLPPAEVDVSMPAVNGSSLAVAADCSNLQTQLNAIANLDGTLTHEVVIPVGSTCVGRFILPAKSGLNPAGTGWLLLRSGGNLPPENTQITPAGATPLARIIGNYVSAYDSPTAPGGCVMGEFWFDIDAPSASLYKCTVNTGPVWTLIPAAAGTTVPSTCNEGDWFYKTNEPDRRKQGWWCTETNAYRNVYFNFGAAYAEWAAIYTAPTAKRWRVTGLTVQALKMPSSYAAQFNQGNSDQKGSIYNCLAYTTKTNDRIIFDRVVFDGFGYPNRTHSAFCTADGSNIGIINSYFNEINQWRTATSFENTPNTIFFFQGPGPVRIENNHFQNCHGITIFHSDDTSDPAPASANDVTIRRNSFYESPANNAADPASNGRYYFRRHMVELKMGQRWLIEGNTFEGGWPSVNQGATISLSPRPGFANILLTPLAVRDVWIRHNIIKYSPQPFFVGGHNDYVNYQTQGTQRVAITNNLTYRSGISSTGGYSGWPGNVFNGQFINMGLGIEDLTIQNNTIHASYTACCNLAVLAHAWDDVNEGLRVSNNIVTMGADASYFTVGGVWLGGGFQGTAALNRMWSREGIPDWVFTNNLLHRPSGASSDYPANNFWITSLAAVAYRDLAGFDFSLVSSSPYRAGGAQAGDNGADLGASIYAIRNANGDVRGVQVLSTAVNQGVFRYTAFDGQACAVDLSTTAGFSTLSRFTDAGGARTRLLTATGLSADTIYYWRLHCGTTTSGTLRTKAVTSGTGNLLVAVKPAASLAVAQAVVDYGSSPAFGATSSPVSCATACSITVSANAGQALYYRIRYRKADTTVIATSATHVAVP